MDCDAYLWHHCWVSRLFQDHHPKEISSSLQVLTLFEDVSLMLSSACFRFLDGLGLSLHLNLLGGMLNVPSIDRLGSLTRWLELLDGIGSFRMSGFETLRKVSNDFVITVSRSTWRTTKINGVAIDLFCTGVIGHPGCMSLN